MNLKTLLYLGITIALSGNSYSSLNIYSDEMSELVKRKESVLEKYAPDNLNRTSFNGFKSSEKIILNEKEYTIHGFRNSNEETKKEIHNKFINTLPNDRAIITNAIGGLNVKGKLIEKINNDYIARVQYGYKPGFLDRSGNSEYTFTVESLLNFADKREYAECEQHIRELNQYQDLDLQDQKEQTISIPQFLGSKTANTSYTQLHQKAHQNLENTLKNYNMMRTQRLNLLTQYANMTNEDKSTARKLSIQILQYRKFITDNANEIATQTNEAKLRDAIISFGNSVTTFSSSINRSLENFFSKLNNNKPAA